MDSINLKYKGFQHKALNVDESSRAVAMMLSGFGNIDDGRDMIIRGAFTKSIQEHGPESDSDRKIIYLWAHDPKDPIGRFTKIEEQETGLYAEAVIDDVENGNRALKQYTSGTLNQHSIGFNYVWDKMEYIEDGDFFLIKEVKLYEGSVVPFGMNENTPFIGFKSLAEKTPDLMQEIESELKNISPVDRIKARKLITKILSLGNFEPHEIRALEGKNKPAAMNIDLLIENFKL